MIESAVAAFGRTMQVGSTVVIGEVDEPTPDILDSALGTLTGTVSRRTTESVEAELAAAADAEFAARREADRVLREQRSAERTSRFEAGKEAVKEKLGID